MTKFLFVLLLVCLMNSAFAQNASSTTASVSAVIIHPVSAGISENSISGKFEPGEMTTGISLQNTTIKLDGKELDIHSYEITVTFEKTINNGDRGSMRVESISLVPGNDSPEKTSVYSIRALVKGSGNQPPGDYRSAKPVNIIFHLN